MKTLSRIKASFCLYGDEFDLKEITKRLDLIPTETRTKDTFPSQGFTHTLWALGIKQYNCTVASEPLEKLVNLFENKIEIIKFLCQKHCLEPIITVEIYMNLGDNPEIALMPEISAFAASINSKMKFDIFCCN